VVRAVGFILPLAARADQSGPHTKAARVGLVDIREGFPVLTNAGLDLIA
jgi:hypothetical protein